MDNIIVSVIIPTYNRASLIGRAIKSVLNQTYQKFEIIIVDDGSTDNTREVAKKFQERDKRIKYFKHAINKGGGAARNTGIRNSKGEYIAFLDSDDEWYPEKLEKQIGIFNKNDENLAAVYSGSFYIDCRSGMAKREIPKKKGYILEDLLKKNVVVGGASPVIIRRKCIESVGGFDERLPSRQDLDLWIRIARCYTFDFIPYPLIKIYRDHGLVRITDNRDAKIEGRAILYNKIKSDLEKKPKIHSLYFLETAKTYFYSENQKDVRKAQEYFIKSIKITPFCFQAYIFGVAILFGRNRLNIINFLKKIKRIIKY